MDRAMVGKQPVVESRLSGEERRKEWGGWGAITAAHKQTVKGSFLLAYTSSGSRAVSVKQASGWGSICLYWGKCLWRIKAEGKEGGETPPAWGRSETPERTKGGKDRGEWVELTHSALLRRSGPG